MTIPYAKPPASIDRPERLHDYLRGDRVLRELRTHAPAALDRLIDDLEHPLSAPFERAVVRALGAERLPGFVPAATLMPTMLTRFGLPAELATEKALEVQRRTCNRCPQVGHCWQALRHGADAEACRGFCPNAEAFTAMGEDPA
ncbi:hypothetical protein [Halomonas sp. 328]|uniref:hypothetical protein n=1 Tax=Halomonas sp. 328 TaxID=2776704 RepID=UPI0018A7456F|nr:hypothetical protein [Halomonas sp. 328]MBF8222556.1 hypothetical protein [Halomonas sp. 328]